MAQTLNRKSQTPIFRSVLPVLSEFNVNKVLNDNYLLKKDSGSKITKTKIVCTLGPSSNTERSIEDLLENGMKIARINLSHGSTVQNSRIIKMVKKLSEQRGEFCSVMVETNGNAVRMAPTKNGEKILLKKDLFVNVKNGDIRNFYSDSNVIYVDYIDLKSMRKNDPITIGYGHIKLVVRDVSEDSLKCQILISGHIFNKKTIYLPDSKINYPKELTEQDKRDLNFAAENKANFVSIPYVCDGKKIKLVRQFLRDKGLENPFIIAKIECEEALINFRQILDETDSILVSRGPLGEEIDLETVTLSQKMIIRKCNVAGKPVITATQMLESMRVNPFPTRAEASDVGNAVFDGTDCVMLSGETACGQYPIKSLQMMNAICKEAERSVDHKETFRMLHDRMIASLNRLSVEEAIASSAVKMSFDIKASALIVYSSTGKNGFLISKYRPKCPILLVTDFETTAKKTILSRGVVPLLVNTLKEDSSLATKVIETAIKLKICKNGDFAVLLKSPDDDSSSNGNLVSVVTVGS